jgi:hypothetical protein
MERIKSSISSILTTIKEELMTRILQKLSDLGVESVDDLSCVTVEDLTMDNLLQPVPARKLVRAWSQSSAVSVGPPTVVPVTRTPSQSPADIGAGIQSTSSLRHTPLSIIRDDWIDNFDPVCMIQNARQHGGTTNLKWSAESLINGQRLNPSQRNEIIRHIVSIISSCKPTRNNLNVVAQKITDSYPTLKDEVDGIVVGPGWVSIRNQLESCLSYLSRPLAVLKKAEGIRRRLVTDEAPIVTKKQLRDGYGCIDFLPVVLPDGETSESVKVKQLQLKHWHAEGRLHETDITSNMRATYMCQRQDLVGHCRLTVIDLLNEWPFLFHPKWMLGHLDQLLGMSLLKKMEESVLAKKDNLIRYLDSKRRSVKRLGQKMSVIDLQSEPVIGIIILLMAYFNEEEEAIFRGFEVCSVLYVGPDS